MKLSFDYIWIKTLLAGYEISSNVTFEEIFSFYRISRDIHDYIRFNLKDI